MAIELPPAYDPERLQRDLAAISDVQPVPNSGSYHDGEWRGVSLWAPGGDPSSADSSSNDLADYGATPVLERTPYLSEVLEELACPKYSVRLLYLPPGGHIKPHADLYHGFASGKIRLHLPIVTNERVVFMLAGERQRWQPGELWYGDVAYTHSVRNEGTTTRVHLVMDVGADDFLLGLFPPEFVLEKERLGILRHKRPVPLPRAELRRYRCVLDVPPGSIPRAVGANITSFPATTGGIVLSERGLVLHVERSPIGILRPLGGDEFDVAGSPQMRVRVEMDEHRRPRAVTLSIHGVPEVFLRALSTEGGLSMTRIAAPTPDGTPEPRCTHRARMVVIRSG